MKTMSRVLLVLIPMVLLANCAPWRENDAFSSASVYDAANNRYLVVYLKTQMDGYPESHSDVTSRICGRFVGPGGRLIGSEFVIAQASYDSEYVYGPSIGIAFDAVHNRFLVAWSINKVVFGKIINADGTSFSRGHALSRNALYWYPAIAYDPDQDVFLILWNEEGVGISGQLINGDGSLAGTNFPVSQGGIEAPSVAYDVSNQRFLAVWSDTAYDAVQGRIILPDGSFLAPEFSLTAAGRDEHLPKIVYDTVSSRFLMAWEHGNGSTFSLQGEVLNADGTIYQPVFAISSTGHDVNNHALAYDPVNQEYFSIFDDHNELRVYGQAVTAQGALDNSVSSDNILLSYGNYVGDSEPALACNGSDGTFLASWTYGTPNDQRIGNADIHGRILNSDGTPAGNIFVIANGGAW